MQVDTTNDALRHPTLYKASGDLAISAVDGDVTHLYRVHALILAEHSPVFAGMLTLPAAADASVQTYDGAPVVHLPDNAKEVKTLLEVLYTPVHPIFKKERTFARDVYGLMSIATKYQIDSICAAVSTRLKEQWPFTKVEFIRTREDSHRSWVGPIHGVGRRIPEPASAIRLATDFNIPEVLPAAYYDLATHEIISLYSSQVKSMAPQWDLLLPEELLRYYQGKHQLTRQFVRCVNMFSSYHDDECETVFDDFDYDAGEYSDSSACRQALEKARTSWNDQLHPIETGYISLMRADVMHALVGVYDDRRKHKLCRPCEVDLGARCKSAIEALWNDLPAIFSLKGLPFYALTPRGQH
ncbi:hypothetical protein PsYK624_121220 [Phanerochaete sordida]|uniref:BTB domain-containing protein n=1 Tax=Phanerochaete sordida TaxID=48140 RepID=A0A9P3GIV5_9APHY|nr:hypothetical protein PsYK624_121220 [Phanerochaete sordida]